MTSELNWNNFDKVADLIETQTEKADNAQKRKDSNEALGQLLGVTDNPVFRKLNTEQQNMFLQHIVDKSGSGAGNVAQKLLEGLHLKAPALAPSTPAPAFGLGMAPPTPGGMGGQMPRVQQQQYHQAPQEDTTPPWFKPTDEDNK
jgi:hypothetical protein